MPLSFPGVLFSPPFPGVLALPSSVFSFLSLSGVVARLLLSLSPFFFPGVLDLSSFSFFSFSADSFLASSSLFFANSFSQNNACSKRYKL